jgi:hypothetical protein
VRCIVAAIMLPPGRVEVCHDCQSSLPRGAAFCSSCGAAVPSAHPELRKRLLECFLDLCDSSQLSRWLEDIGRDPRGRMEEKRERIQRHTKYISMPAADFPEQTIRYLTFHKTQTAAARVCSALDLSVLGSRDALVRRVLRHVHYSERWLPSLETPSTRAVAAIARRYPIAAKSNEASYCDEFEQEAEEVWPGRIHPQYPIAHGTTLKIDFHIGTPRGDGVGVEFKLPRSNADIQRAKGQLDQYLAAYSGSRLVVVILDNESLKRAQLSLFEKEARDRGITVVQRQVLPLSDRAP